MKKILLMACLIAGTMWAVEPENVFRAYNLPQGGYVMIDYQDEVVAMSSEGNVHNVSNGLRQFLYDAGIQIEIMEQEMISQNMDLEFNEPVGPLLNDITFNQTYPYNLEAPIVGGDYCYTGCVATAMAQIMTYWKYPTKCADATVKYKTKTLNYTIELTYDTINFDWGNILHSYGEESTDEQNSAVARLMKACGVSVQININGSGTGSPLVVDALVNIFGYKKGLRFEEKDKDMTSDEFALTLMEEFDAARPVYCSGVTDSDEGGHAFVIDGYKIPVGKENDPRFTYFHFNWGWGGKDNDWLRINSNTPYSKRMQMIRNIVPANYTALETTKNNPTNGRIYDILGNEVSETVPGHIYILNGKKFIAR